MVWLYLLSALPLALFIIFLLVMDSFKLTRWTTLVFCILAGAAMCFLSRLICRIPELAASRLAVSAVEEILKGLILYYLLARHKVGLLGDTSIYGSAIGAGFALVSNAFYLAAHGEVHVAHTVFLGFESAVMHIGCTSTLAMALIMVHQGKFGDTRRAKTLGTAGAFIATILIHYVHALEPINPIAMTVLLVIYFAISKRSLFRKNSKFVHEWVDAGIGNEVTLLSALRRGEFTGTEAGKYLLSLKENFHPETFFDMYCYVQTYLELSIAAKSNLILKEAGMPAVHSPENLARIEEIRALRKRMGRTGEIALSPIVKHNDVNRWAMNNLI